MPALSLTVLTLSLAALGTGPYVPDPLPEPNPARTEIRQVLYAVEGSRLSAILPLGIPFEVPGGANVVVTQAPVYGQLTEEAWPSFTYEPDGDYFGRDRLALEVYGSGGALAIVQLEIDVLPRRIPLVGRWTEGSALAHGLYDPAGGWLQRCNPEAGEPGLPEGGDPGQTAGEVPGTTGDGGIVRMLICTWTRVRDAPPAAIPLVLPGHKDAADRLALFAQSTGTLYFLSDAGSELVVEDTQVLPGAVDRFPVVGSFDAGGPATLAFVGRRGQVGMLGRHGEWIDWSYELELFPGDELAWPFRWPAEEGQDSLALLNPVTGSLTWRSVDGDLGYLRPVHRPTATLLPFRPSAEAVFASVSILWRAPDGLYVARFGFGLYDPSPQTIPLKFPNDPAGP